MLRIIQVAGRHPQARRVIDAAVLGGAGVAESLNRARGASTTAVELSDVVSVVVPAAYGSFGDEALAHGTQNMLAASGRRMRAVVAGDTGDWLRTGIVDAVSEDRHTGTLHLGMKGDAVDALVPGRDLWVLGADYVDGAYGLRSIACRVSLLNAAARAGRAAALVNFSFRKTPRDGAVALLKSLDPRVVIASRDEVSAERFGRATGRQVSAYPDLAMFLRAAESRLSHEVAAWTARHGRRTLMVVGNAHLATHFGGSVDDLARAFGVLCTEAIARGWAVCLLSHDVRETPGDNELMQRIRAYVGATREELFVAIPESAATAKAVLAQADLCIAARMHPAVATLSQGIPTYGLEYVGKFAGQFAWYGAMDHLSPWTDLVADPSMLARRILEQDWVAERRRLNGVAERLRSTLPPWSAAQ